MLGKTHRRPLVGAAVLWVTGGECRAFEQRGAQWVSRKGPGRLSHFRDEKSYDKAAVQAAVRSGHLLVVDDNEVPRRLVPAFETARLSNG